MTLPKNYCHELQGGLWLEYDTESSQWVSKPCCLFKKSFPISNDIKKEFWLDPILQKERTDNLLGHELTNNCQVCKNVEKVGNYSRRQGWNDRLVTDHWPNSSSVTLLDLHVDFSCNLACRICNPKYSTLWRQVMPDEFQQKFKVRSNTKTVFDLLKTIPLNNLQQLHIQGGEPLLSTTHLQILEKLQDIVDPSQLIIWYHSNATVRAPDKVLKLWEKFKSIELHFSLDDMGARMEYQRWPMQWHETHENLMWYKNNLPHNTMLNIARAVGVLNAGWVTELEHWHSEYFSHTKYGDKININYHDCTQEYSLNALTHEYQDFILNSLPTDHWVYSRIKNAPVDNQMAITQLLHHLNTHDVVRKQNWQTVYPEFLNWYKRYI